MDDIKSMIIVQYPMDSSPIFSLLISHAEINVPITVAISAAAVPMHIPTGIDFDVPVTFLFLTMSFPSPSVPSILHPWKKRTGTGKTCPGGID